MRLEMCVVMRTRETAWELRKRDSALAQERSEPREAPQLVACGESLEEALADRLQAGSEGGVSLSIRRQCITT